jgi:DnaJ-class molecular chaperone
MTPGRRKPPSRTAPEPSNPGKRKALPIMAHTAATAQQTCSKCNGTGTGTGTVQKSIYNTATGKWETLAETCLDCSA